MAALLRLKWWHSSAWKLPNFLYWSKIARFTQPCLPTSTRPSCIVFAQLASKTSRFVTAVVNNLALQSRKESISSDTNWSLLYCGSYRILAIDCYQSRFFLRVRPTVANLYQNVYAVVGSDRHLKCQYTISYAHIDTSTWTIHQECNRQSSVLFTFKCLYKCRQPTKSEGWLLSEAIEGLNQEAKCCSYSSERHTLPCSAWRKEHSKRPQL